MTEFIISWGPYGPSGRVQADNLDHASAMVHGALETLGLYVVARHLPNTETPSDDPMMPWEGAVLVMESPVKRYGDQGQVRVAVYHSTKTSYFDKQRCKMEADKAAVPAQTCQGLKLEPKASA